MIVSETDVESPSDVSVPTPDLRERVVVRRRRGKSHRQRSRTWTARASRRKAVRAFVVCAGVLVLMAIGLYFGLSRQNTTPADTSLDVPVLASRALG